VDEIFKQAALALRELGFKGSNPTYRKFDGDFVFVINFQRSQYGDVFYVNLGAQPTAVPAIADASLKTLKEYECIWRQRVGRDWPMQQSEPQFTAFIDELRASQQTFFDHAKTFPAALTTHTPRELLEQFGEGPPGTIGTLHLARAALALNHPDVARELATIGLAVANSAATNFVAELQKVLARIPVLAPRRL
jgi:hypothetical protein